MIAHRRGFTLIELMATTVLAGLLMVALLQVVTMIGRTRTLMDKPPIGVTGLEGEPQHRWQEQLLSELTADLQAARSVRWSDGQLVIEGVGGWNRVTREHTHEPARVTYRTEEDLPGSMTRTPGSVGVSGVNSGVGGGGSGGLVRGQRDVLDLGQQREDQQLMAWGVARFEVTGERESRLIDETDAPVAGPSDLDVVVGFVDGSVLRVPIPNDRWNDGETRP